MFMHCLDYIYLGLTMIVVFWLLFFGCYAAKEIALQVQQERTQAVCSNKEAWKHLTESNGTPTMDLGLGTDHIFMNLLFPCSRHALGIRIPFFRSFVTKGLLRDYFTYRQVKTTA